MSFNRFFGMRDAIHFRLSAYLAYEMIDVGDPIEKAVLYPCGTK